MNLCYFFIIQNNENGINSISNKKKGLKPVLTKTEILYF